MQKRSVWIAPVFLPHLGCPHRCVFCNQNLITSFTVPPAPEQIQERLEDLFRSQKREGRRRQIAFYGGSFTGMDPLLQRAYLDVALAFLRQGRADSIRVSARPDELPRERVLFLVERGVKTIEIGVQSLADRVLEASRRGHSSRDAMEAVQRCRQLGLETGAQIMVGLPDDTEATSMSTAELLCDLRPHFVRIYPALVFRNTELARRMEGGGYRPWGMEEAIDVCARMVERFEKACIPVVRIGMQNGEGMEGGVRAGPYHPAFGHMVRARLFCRKMVRSLPQPLLPGRAVCFRIHPHDRPFLSGYRGQNLERLRRKLGDRAIRVHEDHGQPRGTVRSVCC